ncbi:hypothetical protein E4U21_006421 [Claviceps maximensis]|nr:hypothetical protein E4U21_006421 [Claviceps maximensis]
MVRPQHGHISDKPLSLDNTTVLRPDMASPIPFWTRMPNAMPAHSTSAALTGLKWRSLTPKTTKHPQNMAFNTGTCDSNMDNDVP